MSESSGIRSGLKIAADRLGDAADFAESQLGIQRKTERFVRQALAVREIAGLASEAPKGGLQVQRLRIMHTARNPVLLKVGVQPVALRRADGIKVKNMFPI